MLLFCLLPTREPVSTDFILDLRLSVAHEDTTIRVARAHLGLRAL